MCLSLSSFDTTKAKEGLFIIMNEWMDLMGRIGQEIGVMDWKESPCHYHNLMRVEESGDQITERKRI